MKSSLNAKQSIIESGNMHQAMHRPYDLYANIRNVNVGALTFTLSLSHIAAPFALS